MVAVALEGSNIMLEVRRSVLRVVDQSGVLHKVSIHIRASIVNAYFRLLFSIDTLLIWTSFSRLD
jgi:hypothetical protein